MVRKIDKRRVISMYKLRESDESLARKEMAHRPVGSKFNRVSNAHGGNRFIHPNSMEEVLEKLANSQKIKQKRKKL